MPKSKWRKVCPLRRRFLLEIQLADSVVILMRVAICYEYSAKLVQEKICAKVHKTCGIKISEDDTRSKVLCRSCVSFVNKMEQFIQRAQSIENTLSDQSAEYAVKRCVQLSPSSLQPSKRLSRNMPSESFVHVDELSKPITPTRKQLSFSTPQTATILMPKSTGDTCPTSSVNQPARNTSRSVEQSSFATLQDATGHDCTITSMNQPST